MNAELLLVQCQKLGVTLAPSPDGKLLFSPPDKLPGELREQLRQHKVEVLALLTRPHINIRGELIIPFESDPKYHFWKPGGQSLAETLHELNAPPDVWRRYVEGYTETRQ